MPLDLVLVHKSDETELNSQLGENLDEFTAMAVKLLRERAQLQQSFYYPYIQVCRPRQLQNYGLEEEIMPRLATK